MSSKPKFYKQYDKKWANTKWANSTLKKYGSGPTCIANAISVFTELDYINITPLEVFTFICESGNMVDKSGTRWAGISAGLTHYGVSKVVDTNNSDTVKKALKNGDWVIAAVGESRWAKKGHYILVYKIKEDNILVSDSASNLDSRQTKGTWNELKTAAVHYWIISDTESYGPDDTSDEEFEDENLIDSDFGTDGVYVDYDELRPNILTVNRNIEPSKFRPKDWKDNKVVGVMLEAGKYYNSKHEPVKTFRNPLLYDQVNKLIQANMPYGYFFHARAQNTNEINDEIYEFSFVIRKYPPTLGVWLYPDFLSSDTKFDDTLLSNYETELIRLGLTGKIGIRCKRDELKKFSWEKFQERWWLWLNDHVNDLDAINDLLDPKFFDTDDKSGELPEGEYLRNQNKADKFDNRIRNYNYGSFGKHNCSDVADAAATWAEKIAADNRFTYGTGSRARHCGCYFCGTNVHGPKRARKGDKWDFTYCCNPVCTAAYVHGGHIAKKCWNSGLTIRSWTSRGFKCLGRNLKLDKLQRGDLILRLHKHIAMYLGNNKSLEARSRKGFGKDSISIRNFSKHWEGTWYVLRYVGKKK